MIERVIKNVTDQLYPSFGDNLLGFSIDSEYYLEEQEKFNSVDVKVTSNNLCLITADITISADMPSLQSINHSLYEVWQSIQYSYFEASSCQWFQEATVFRFVTIICDSGFYVTCEFNVTGNTYSKLVKRFENDFKAIECSIPNMSKT